MAALLTLLVLIFLSTLCSAFMVAWLFFRDFKRSMERRRDDELEMKERPDRFDQGIENILSFSVKGMTGYEGEERE